MSGLQNPYDDVLLSDAIGTMGSDKGVTAQLFVCPNGDNTTGKSWTSAYTTIQAALDAASTDGDDLTIIYISPHTTNYDINTTGDPTWTGNYILKGSHRNWAKIKNNHASATSVMKFSGKVALIDLNINMGADNNGIIMTHGGFRVYHCMFVGEDLTSSGTALHLDGTSTIKNGKIMYCDFRGDGSNMTGILLDNAACTEIKNVRIGFGAAGIQQVNAASDYNKVHDVELCSNTIGLDIDAGNVLLCEHIDFHGNTTNIDDEVGDHIYSMLHGQFPITVEPDDFSGVALTAGADANVWGSDTEVRAAATSTVPFRIVAYAMQPNISQWYRVRFSDDSGSTFFDDIMVDASRLQGNIAPSGTEYIFNKGTRISASTKAESGGEDTIAVWLEIQEI